MLEDGIFTRATGSAPARTKQTGARFLRASPRAGSSAGTRRPPAWTWS